MDKIKKTYVKKIYDLMVFIVIKLEEILINTIYI